MAFKAFIYLFFFSIHYRNEQKLSLSDYNVYNDDDDSLHWRYNGHDDVSNHKPHHCLLNRLFGRRSKKTSKLRVTGLRVGNFPAQMASNAENVSV